MTRTLALLSMVLMGGTVLAGGVLMHTAALPAEQANSAQTTAHFETFDEHSMWGTFKIYCDTCHFGPKARAGLNLEALNLANLDDSGATWEKVLRTLRTGVMPPPGAPRPDKATYQTLVKAIEGERDRLVDVNPTPGRPTLHRLNRA